VRELDAADESGAPLHTREAKVGPTNLTYSDLYSIIESVRDLAHTANAGLDPKIRQTLRLQSDGTSLELPGDFTEQRLANAPPVTTAVYFSFDAEYVKETASDVSVQDCPISNCYVSPGG
jgi:hypothetical protein